MSSAVMSEPRSVSAKWPGVLGWVLFDWAAQPFYTLITTFLFASYFANVVAADKAQGFAQWGYAMAASGLIVAIISPVLGAVADQTGGLKRWIAGFSVLFVAGQSALWFAMPGRPDLVMPILAAVILASASAEFAAVFNNAMMRAVVPPGSFGRLSGAGWAVGYVGGLLSLIFITGFVISGPEAGRTSLGLPPLFALDAASHAADRLIGPFCALWYFIFVIPLFLFTPDVPNNPVSFNEAAGRGLRELRATLRDLPAMRDVLRFLIARMLYIDGLLALFTFGGIYASSLFGWSMMQLGFYGILLSVTAAIGAALGGFLDDAFGAKPVITGSLLLLIAGVLGILAIDPDLAGVALGAGAFGGLDVAGFVRPAEFVYLGFSMLIGLASGPVQASSRSLIARMVPPDRIAEFFGLYAFSGKVTAFFAPLAVSAATAATGSQKAGIASILVFLVAGLVLFIGVRPVAQSDAGAKS
jgi:UMF1 family MFS transporter